MIDDWLAIFAGIVLVLTLPLALNVRGMADRRAQANRRDRRLPWLPMSMNLPPTAQLQPGTNVRTVRRQAALTIVAAVITLVICLT
jgi:hypothetical protein